MTRRARPTPHPDPLAGLLVDDEVALAGLLDHPHGDEDALAAPRRPDDERA